MRWFRKRRRSDVNQVINDSQEGFEFTLSVLRTGRIALNIEAGPEFEQRLRSNQAVHVERLRRMGA